MEEYEIYYRDLNEETRASLRKQFGVDSDEELEAITNWDVHPLTTVIV